MRTTLALMMLGLMIALPLAAAQDAEPTTTEANATDDHPTGGPGVGPCPRDVNCAGGTKPTTGSGTCMDGQQGNETCDPNVYYFGGGPADSGPSTTNATADPQLHDSQVTSDPPQGARAVPALAAAGIVGAAIVATLLLAGRRP